MGQVTLNNISKKYKDVSAVEKVGLDIKDGEFVTFVGPSGCGKSTSLEMIAGLTKPTDGTITIAGRDVTHLPPKDRDIAMVFQNIALFPHMDVYENVNFGLNLRNYDPDEIETRVEDALTTVEMSGTEERMPDELSGGQRQRVAIARAIVREPEVFLMDEPLANLDAKLRVHMRTELQRIHNKLKTTVIYVTHDQAEAMTMSDRVAVLNEGRLQQLAPPLTCYTEPSNLFVAGFIGSPSMNLVDAELTADAITTENFSIAVDGDRLMEIDSNQDVVFGVRPDNIYLAENANQARNPSNHIDAITEVLEPMGDEIFVYLQLDGEQNGTHQDDESEHDSRQLLMSVDPDWDLKVGEEVSIVVDRKQAHLFDPQSGEAIRHNVSGSE